MIMSFFCRIGRFFWLTWHLLKTVIEMLYGVFRISKLPHPIVTIFGSARVTPNTPYAQKASELGRRLVEQNVSVLTGGGPGIMAAVSCGALEHRRGKGKIVGIGVRSLGEERNACLDDYFELEYFYARKWLLTQYSSAFIIFPGGFGTLDELAEVLTLIQTNSLKRVPIVLIGKEYWQKFIDWLMSEPLAHGMIQKEYLEFFKVTDQLEEAYCWVLGRCQVPVK